MGAGGRRRKVLFVVGAVAAERERVAAAVRSTADAMRQCVTLDGVDAALIAGSAAVIVIVPDQTPTPLLVSAIRQYRVEDPATAMLLCLQPGDRTVHQLATLARAGLDDLVIIDDRHHTADQLRAEVSRRLKYDLPVELVRRVAPQAGDDSGTICAYSFRNGFRNLKVEQVAIWWDCNVRTLNRHLNKAVPSDAPSQFLMLDAAGNVTGEVQGSPRLRLMRVEGEQVFCTAKTDEGSSYVVVLGLVRAP